MEAFKQVDVAARIPGRAVRLPAPKAKTPLGLVASEHCSPALDSGQGRIPPTDLQTSFPLGWEAHTQGMPPHASVHLFSYCRVIHKQAHCHPQLEWIRGASVRHVVRSQRFPTSLKLRGPNTPLNSDAGYLQELREAQAGWHPLNFLRRLQATAGTGDALPGTLLHKTWSRQAPA